MRHLARSLAFQVLYEWDFRKGEGADIMAILDRDILEFAPGLENKAFARHLLEGIIAEQSQLDQLIEKAAPEWPIDQIAVIDRNVLRIGLYELLFSDYKEIPPKVAINEAIELAKTFGGENSGKFVNGVLGTIYRELGEPGKEESAKKQLTPEEIKKLPVEACAGAVVWRKEKNNYFIALVHDVFGRWTLPKGHLEGEEAVKEGAVRKVKEEIGVYNLEVGEKVGEIEYVAHDPETGPVRRAVTYFLARTEDKELKLKITGGLDDVRWFSADELENITTYDDIKQILQNAKTTLGIV